MAQQRESSVQIYMQMIVAETQVTNMSDRALLKSAPYIQDYADASFTDTEARSITAVEIRATKLSWSCAGRKLTAHDPGHIDKRILCAFHPQRAHRVVWLTMLSIWNGYCTAGVSGYRLMRFKTWQRPIYEMRCSYPQPDKDTIPPRGG